MHGVDRETVLSADWDGLQQLEDIAPLDPLIREIGQGSFRHKTTSGSQVGAAVKSSGGGTLGLQYAVF